MKSQHTLTHAERVDVANWFGQAVEENQDISQQYLTGFGGECALAAMLGVDWLPAHRKDVADVWAYGRWFEARCSAQPNPPLMIHGERDQYLPLDAIYVALRHNGGWNYTMRGWLTVAEAQPLIRKIHIGTTLVTAVLPDHLHTPIELQQELMGDPTSPPIRFPRQIHPQPVDNPGSDTARGDRN